MKKMRSAAATWLLLIGVFFWGCTFVIVKEAVAVVDPYSFVAVRFAIGGALLGLLFFKNLFKLNKQTIIISIYSGLILAASFIFQTTALKYTTASNTAFITGLCVVFVPVLVSIIDKRLPTSTQTASVFMAFIGLALMTLKLPLELNFGDFLAFLCAIGFGIQLVIVGRLPKNVNAPAFTILQLLIVSIVSLICGLIINKKIMFSDNRIVLRAVLFCAVFATSYVYLAQAHFQRYISEIKTVVIFSLEPVFAALIAFIYFEEKLSPKAVAGAVLIFAAMIVSELKMKPADRIV
jgi:drug/metabolite transporter (DMT)-like permease